MFRLSVISAIMVAPALAQTQPTFSQTTPTIFQLWNTPAQQQPFWVTAHANFIAGLEGDEELFRHAHDPQQDIYFQGLDLGLNLQPTDWFSGFFNLNSFQELDGGFGSEWEEGFLKVVDPTYGFELRAGRFLNRIGNQNQVHLHGWDYADANLSTTSFFGDEGLAMNGVELSWGTTFDRGGFLGSVAYGEALSHDRAHGDDEHDEHDEHEDEHCAEGFNDEVITARGLFYYNVTDFHQNNLGFNYAKNVGGGTDREVYGMDYTYQWRENGLEIGGRAFRLRGEYFVMETDDDTYNSALLSARYEFNQNWSLGARYEWIEFCSELDEVLLTDERQRASIALTYTYSFYENWIGVARAQYNNDWLDSGEDRSGAWFQIGLNYGGREIR